jgi:hypothetical protein
MPAESVAPKTTADNGSASKPNEPASTASGAGNSATTARKATYRVYADSAVLDAIAKFGRESTTEDIDELAASFPNVIGDGDLVLLDEYEAYNRSNAVEQMLKDDQPNDRVGLVQLVHQEHVDLHFPVSAHSYTKLVPVVWQTKPTMSIGG